MGVPEVLGISGLFNSLQKSGAEKYSLQTLCFFMRLPHLLKENSALDSIRPEVEAIARRKIQGATQFPCEQGTEPGLTLLIF